MPSSEKNMIHQKRGTWWAVDPKKGKKGFASEEKQKHGLQKARKNLNLKKNLKLKRTSKWLLVDEDEAPKENQYQQTKPYTQELKQRQDVSLPFILLHMQMLGW